jgi:hypothetical protein
VISDTVVAGEDHRSVGTYLLIGGYGGRVFEVVVWMGCSLESVCWKLRFGASVTSDRRCTYVDVWIIPRG